MHTFINRYRFVTMQPFPIKYFQFAINHTFISIKISSNLTIPAKEFITFKTLLAFNFLINKNMHLKYQRTCKIFSQRSLIHEQD